jgi:hypothetical protein
MEALASPIKETTLPVGRKVDKAAESKEFCWSKVVGLSGKIGGVGAEQPDLAS